MKKHKSFIILFFVFLFSSFGFDLFLSFVIKKDNNLTTKVILESDYLNLKREYESLLEKVNIENILEGEYVVSKVIFHDPYVFFDTITVLKGKKDNIEVGDIVYDEKGFIGTVSLVDEHHSTVKLVTNKDTQLSVRINNSYGILQREHEDLVVTSITSKEQIQEGDIVYTSSFSVVGLEIPVGTVTEVESNGIEQKVKVKPTTDIFNLNYVLIRKKNTHV